MREKRGLQKISSWRLNKREEGGGGISEPTGPCTLSYQAETPARAHILGEKPKARANAHTLDSHEKKREKSYTLESTIIPVLTMWKSEAPSSTSWRAKTRNQHIKYSHRRKKSVFVIPHSPLPPPPPTSNKTQYTASIQSPHTQILYRLLPLLLPNTVSLRYYTV